MPDLNITRFFSNARPAYYSASVAELGDIAGRITWENAVDAAEEYPLLDTPEKVDAFKAFVRSAGAWTEEEIGAWTHDELTALAIQWVAGDIRQAGLDSGTTWEEYEASGQGGNLYRGDDGQVYFSLD